MSQSWSLGKRIGLHIHFFLNMNASYPTQAPTTGDNIINADSNLPTGNNFAHPPLNAEGSEEPAG